MANQQDINYHSLIYHIFVWLDIFLQKTTIHTQCVVYRLHFPPSLEFIYYYYTHYYLSCRKCVNE